MGSVLPTGIHFACACSSNWCVCVGLLPTGSADVALEDCSWGRMLFFQLVPMVPVPLWAADLVGSGGIVGQGEDDEFGGFGHQSGSYMLQCLMGGLPTGLTFSSVYAYFKNYRSSHVSDKLHTFLVYSRSA